MDEATRITLNTLWYALLAALLMPLPEDVRCSCLSTLRQLADALDRPYPFQSRAERRQARTNMLR